MTYTSNSFYLYPLYADRTDFFTLRECPKSPEAKRVGNTSFCTVLIDSPWGYNLSEYIICEYAYFFNNLMLTVLELFCLNLEKNRKSFGKKHIRLFFYDDFFQKSRKNLHIWFLRRFFSNIDWELVLERRTAPHNSVMLFCPNNVKSPFSRKLLLLC